MKAYIPSIGLGMTQIVGYGTLMYAYAVLLPVMADDLNLTLSTVYGILSLGLFFGGLISPLAGTLVDRYGGRYVMSLGSFISGLALLSLSFVEGRVSLFAGILLAEAAGMFVLYNVASTIFWPLTLTLETQLGWRVSWLVLGVLLLVTCIPIHYVVLAGPQRAASKENEQVHPDWPQLEGRNRQRGMLWMVVSFVFSGYLMGAVMTLWVTNIQDLGHTAAMAAIAGAVIGPFKTVGRFLEMIVSRNLYPMVTYLLAIGLMMSGFIVLLIFGFNIVGVVAAAALYGMGDGIKTIARGTLPLALFGRKGYGARLGWISFVQLGTNASAPFVFAWMTERYGGWWSFAAMAMILSIAILTYFLIPDPRKVK